uniref:Uncharacterized protein n=1 Tax=Ascaris lumbricoides TaxID=6252 RepID=A0A0M3IET2_ASCLU
MIGKALPGRESNPGLARDRRGYSPLYYRGHIWVKMSSLQETLHIKITVKADRTNSHSPAGNRTRVSHVTGADTHHYTTEDTSGSKCQVSKKLYI